MLINNIDAKLQLTTQWNGAPETCKGKQLLLTFLLHLELPPLTEIHNRGNSF